MRDTVDIVIPLSRGSRWGDTELRYCLRSLSRLFVELGKVWIIGHRPVWLREPRAATGGSLAHLPFADRHRSADRNIIAKIERACLAGVTERFVFVSDDQVFLRPCRYQDLGPFTLGELRGRPARRTRWERRLFRTRDWLAELGLPAFHCDTHVPIPMCRHVFLELAERTRGTWDNGDGLTVGTWYCNGANAKVQSIARRTATIERPRDRLALVRALRHASFLGYNDAGLNAALKALLGGLFPEKCGFEK